MNTLDGAALQLAAVKEFFDGIAAQSASIEYVDENEVAIAA